VIWPLARRCPCPSLTSSTTSSTLSGQSMSNPLEFRVIFEREREDTMDDEVFVGLSTVGLSRAHRDHVPLGPALSEGRGVRLRSDPNSSSGRFHRNSVA
jgi:hypothetical protein